jgi:uncharacterized Zn-binding protein involved in type VI secretion
MPGQTRLDDYCTGHDACVPTPLVTCSPNVFIEGKGAGRVGDQYAPHGCIVHATHQDSISAGSSTVFINGRQAGRIGDPVIIGGFVRDGSGTVNIGG